MGGACSTHERYEKCMIENLKGRDQSENLGIDEMMIILEVISEKYDGFIWLRVRTSGMLL
jgi:hypothetical protein